MPVELNQFDQRRALEQLKVEAKKKCTPEFEGTVSNLLEVEANQDEAFVGCSRGTLGAVTHCKPLFNILNDCLKQQYGILAILNYFSLNCVVQLMKTITG